MESSNTPEDATDKSSDEQIYLNKSGRTLTVEEQEELVKIDSEVKAKKFLTNLLSRFNNCYQIFEHLITKYPSLYWKEAVFKDVFLDTLRYKFSNKHKTLLFLKNILNNSETTLMENEYKNWANLTKITYMPGRLDLYIGILFLNNATLFLRQCTKQKQIDTLTIILQYLFRSDEIFMSTITLEELKTVFSTIQTFTQSSTSPSITLTQTLNMTLLKEALFFMQALRVFSLEKDGRQIPEEDLWDLACLSFNIPYSDKEFSIVNCIEVNIFTRLHNNKRYLDFLIYRATTTKCADDTIGVRTINTRHDADTRRFSTGTRPLTNSMLRVNAYNKKQDEGTVARDEGMPPGDILNAHLSKVMLSNYSWLIDVVGFRSDNKKVDSINNQDSKKNEAKCIEMAALQRQNRITIIK